MKNSRVQNNHVCPHRFAFMLDNWIRRLFQNPPKILNGYVKTGDTVMDIGCGPGFFTIDMARMVGPQGRVVAIDLQPEMLASTLKKAARKGVAGQVVAHRCAENHIGWHDQADFILAYYMVHETPDQRSFFEEARKMLAENGRLLVVEPRMHVPLKAFEDTLAMAEKAGLAVVERPTGKGGYSALLRR